MEVYSERTIMLTQMIRKEIREFLNIYQKKSGDNRKIYEREYSVIIFPDGKENKNGFCRKEGRKFLLGFCEKIFHETVDWEDTKGIIGHEVAHLIVKRNIGDTFAHGDAFKEVCKILQVQEEFSKAVSSLKTPVSNSLLNKIKKLLALSESPNQHESNSALLKAKKIMLENNIKTINPDEDKVYRTVLFEYKRMTTELWVISSIVSLITNVWNIQVKNYPEVNKLYIHGTKSEIEISEYLFYYLKEELGRLYSEAKKNIRNKRGAKKSFYLGAYDELTKRFNKEKSILKEDKQLMISHTERIAELSKKYVYQNSKFNTSRRNISSGNFEAASSGKKAGKSVRIYQGIKDNKKSKTLQLS